MDNRICVGHIYAFGGTTMRVLCIRENQVMLENWGSGRLLQYVVAIDPYLCGDTIGWHLSAAYFPCDDRTQFEAFQKSWKYMQGAAYVHALIADTKYGPSVTLYGNRQLAMQALQRELDNSDPIQSLAEFRGIKPLTAEAYMQGILADAPLPIDEYTIRTRAVNESIPEIEEE